MIIDVHTHTFPDALAERAVTTLAARAGIAAHTDGTNAGLRASMARAGVDLSVLMPIATKPSQVRSINAWAAEINREARGLLSFGTLHPAQDDWAAEIARLVDDGIPGIKLHPDYQDVFVDDPALLPIYRALADAGRVMLVHAGVDIGVPPPVHCSPERLARVLDAVPGLTVIAAHLGGYQQWDDVARCLLGRDLYLDTCYTLDDLGEAAFCDIVRAHGVSRVLFGTDSPWKDQAAEVAHLQALPLTDNEKAAILGGNAWGLSCLYHGV
jgi:predicted TIM-barrel fold metal-dependent hydrolase